MSRWFGSVNHNDISNLYIILGVGAGLLGSIMSWLLRLEMTICGNNFTFNNHFFNVMTTAHALVIIFFFLMPVLISGFGNMLIPLFCMVPDIAFPRMNNLSYWLIAPALVIVLMSSVIEGGAGCSWTVYPPVSGTLSHPGACVDCVIFALHLAGASSIMGGINFMTTVLVFGRDIYASDVFLWAFFITVFLLVLSLPVLAAGITILLFDRNINAAFFGEVGGGDPVLFQHLFWFFSHPEVYVLVLPAFGVLSHVLIFFSLSRECWGYYSMVWAIAGIGIIGCVVWAHHIFTVGMDIDTRNYFTAATMVIGVPTGVKIFSWLFMLFEVGYISNSVLVWVYGFLWLFTVGGVTGITLSNNSVDLVLHDTYFVVAHFHYVLSISAVYGVCLSFIHWIGMFNYSDVVNFLNQCFFFSLFCGVNLVFFPIHELGLDSLPRRYFSFIDSLLILNIVTTLGVLFTVSAWIFLAFLLYVGWKCAIGIDSDVIGTDWLYGSTIPLHTHIEVAYFVRLHVQNLLENSWWSLCMAMMLVSLMVNFIHMFRMSIIPWIALFICVLVGYFWSRDVVREGSYLGSHTSIISYSIIVSMGWFVFSEVMFFSGFFSAIFYNFYAGEVDDSALIGVNLLDPFGVPLLNTVLLVSSGVVGTYVHEFGLMGKVSPYYLFVSVVLSAVFFWFQFVEFSFCDFSLSDGLFGSCFFSLTGFHSFHVVVGIFLLIVPFFRFYVNQFSTKVVILDCSMIYWHFVDVVWIFVMGLIYCVPWFS